MEPGTAAISKGSATKCTHAHPPTPENIASLHLFVFLSQRKRYTSFWMHQLSGKVLQVLSSETPLCHGGVTKRSTPVCKLLATAKLGLCEETPLCCLSIWVQYFLHWLILAFKHRKQRSFSACTNRDPLRQRHWGLKLRHCVCDDEECTLTLSYGPSTSNTN